MSWWLRMFRSIEICLYFLFVVCMLTGDSITSSTESKDAARRFTRPYEFDYLSWTLGAMDLKLEQAAISSPFTLAENSRHRLVLDYISLVGDILSLENRINLVYSNPKIDDPATVSTSLRNELGSLQLRLRFLGPLAESVLQEQLTSILTDMNLTAGGQPIPPVLFHVSPLPYDLIISPRDRIQQDAAISLDPNLPLEKQISLEKAVDTGLYVSSLVVPVGGIGSYPTMVMRSTSLEWLADTIAHEWVHNWLTLHPLGLNYETSPELRTMNETTASIAGHEISVLFIQHFYPVFSAGHVLQFINRSISPAEEVFDFNKEMHLTRVRVDELLAQGKIQEAEAYMEQRRLFLWDHGYAIRKLNQAYFAFYGAYAETPAGAAGEDPVGPAVRLLRQRSSSLAAFLRSIARMSSFDQLKEAIAP
jgi:hypothetical protein